jgi:hypothetical protein
VGYWEMQVMSAHSGKTDQHKIDVSADWVTLCLNTSVFAPLDHATIKACI